MSAETMDVRLSVIETRLGHIEQTIDTRMATREGVDAAVNGVKAEFGERMQRLETRIVLWVVGVAIAQPIAFLSALWIAKRSGLLDFLFGA